MVSMLLIIRISYQKVDKFFTTKKCQEIRSNPAFSNYLISPRFNELNDGYQISTPDSVYCVDITYRKNIYLVVITDMCLKKSFIFGSEIMPTVEYLKRVFKSFFIDSGRIGIRSYFEPFITLRMDFSLPMSNLALVEFLMSLPLKLWFADGQFGNQQAESVNARIWKKVGEFCIEGYDGLDFLDLPFDIKFKTLKLIVEKLNSTPTYNSKYIPRGLSSIDLEFSLKFINLPSVQVAKSTEPEHYTIRKLKDIAALFVKCRALENLMFIGHLMKKIWKVWRTA